jgi:hypothetical protein
MRRYSIGSVSALVAVVLIGAAVGKSDAQVVNPRSEQCSRLSRQVDEAIKTHAKGMQVTTAKTLERKANRLCASKRQAQGIRTLANALKVLGASPVDPDP